MDILAGLNDRQLEAVTTQQHSTLVLAGAGSGKTRVLTTRIAYALRERMAHPSEILAVTFTNKAAKEMRTRLETMVSLDIRSMWMGTFHGLCARLLRLHAQEANLAKTFQIMDSADQLAMIKRVMKAANVSTETIEPRDVVNFINWQKEHGIRSWSTSLANEHRLKVDLFRQYEEACAKEGVVDFAELLLRCYELLDKNEIIRKHYQKRFRMIFVDEFQDTNNLQYRWLLLLGGWGVENRGQHPSLNRVFAVGDDDQSIYAFRGANVENMQFFLRDFCEGEPIRLEQNYRSTSIILDAANALIAKNKGRLGKNLWTQANTGERIILQSFDDDRAEARAVARMIQQGVAYGHALQDYAILYRTNTQSRAFEQAFQNQGLRYRIYGGQRFFDRMEVKHVLAYLRLLDNPTDNTSFLRVVNFPARGIGAKTLADLVTQAERLGVSLWVALDSTGPDWTPSPKLLAFRRKILSIRRVTEGLPLDVVVKTVLAESGLVTHFEADKKEGPERIANMKEVISAAKGYYEAEGLHERANAYQVMQDESGLTPLQGFLTQATLEPGDTNEGEQKDAIQMMTVHASKGLEFAHVFIVGLEEGIFPHFSAQKELRGREEERRLMYVAVTRARKTLHITHCATRMMAGHYVSNMPSPFIDDIPTHLVHDQRTTFARARRGYDEDEDAMTRSRTSYGGSSRYGASRGGSYWEKRRQEYDTDWGGASKPKFVKQGTKQPLDIKRFVRTADTFFDSNLSITKQQAAKTGASIGLQVGSHFIHEKFGEGVVQAIRGSGDQTTLRVSFGGTRRTLVYSYIKNRITILL